MPPSMSPLRAEETHLMKEYQDLPTSASSPSSPTFIEKNQDRNQFIHNAYKTLKSSRPYLIPSFFAPSGTALGKAKLHPTSYLDGLRGVAAFFVVLHHFLLDWFPSLVYSYGSSPDNRYLFQLPFIRIIYSGGGMVSTFFVISGYVLSRKVCFCLRSLSMLF
jgi:hypothetical protein